MLIKYEESIENLSESSIADDDNISAKRFKSDNENENVKTSQSTLFPQSLPEIFARNFQASSDSETPPYFNILNLMAAQRAAAVAAMGFQAGNPLAAAAAANWMLNGNNNFGKASIDNEKVKAAKTESPSTKEVNNEKTLASTEMLSPNNVASAITAKFFSNANSSNQVAQAIIAHLQQRAQ
uniref:Uncharacterized protein n=1 Tax=Panagrolaimus superbus TaxID=310955 RepID=A0A914YSS4_9BILA